MSDDLLGAGSDALMTTSEPCLVHPKHRPESHVNHRHHVWPKGEGGPDIPENIVVICPTGHSNVHNLMRELKIRRGELPYSLVKRYGYGERDLALLGYDRIRRQAM